MISNLIVDQTAGNPAARRGRRARAPSRDAVGHPVHPERGARRRPVRSLQLVVHALRPVLRPRPRPGQQGRRGTVFMPLSPGDPLYDAATPQTNFMVVTRATGSPGSTTQPDRHVRRPEPDLHLAPVAPGVPPRVRRGRRRQAGQRRHDAGGHHRRRHARRHGHVGHRQGPGARPARASQLDDRGRPQPAAAGDRPVRQVPARRQRVPAAGAARATRCVEGNPDAPVDATPAPSGPGTPSSTTSPTPPPVRRPRPRPRHAAPALTQDADTVAGNATAATGIYDDELLDEHFVAGDGRVNENIGLTAVHHIFHAEHNRLAADPSAGGSSIKDVLRQRGPGQHLRLADLARRLGRRADLPGRALRHRDGVPAPRVRGVRPQGPADGQRLRRGWHGLQHLHQPGDPRGVRPRGLPLRALDADRDRGPRARPTARTQGHEPARRVPEPGGVRRRRHGGSRRRGRPHRARHDPPDRQRDRRVRHRGAAQQPARPAAGPAGDQHRPGPGDRRAVG